jgi:hypothetical protein
MGDRGSASACSVAAADAPYLAAHPDLRALITPDRAKHQLLVKKPERRQPNDRKNTASCVIALAIRAPTLKHDEFAEVGT